MFFTTLSSRSNKLVRVWRSTGNPAAPLAAVWLTAAQAATLTATDTAADNATEGGLRLCA